jgi:hypothetical protein
VADDFLLELVFDPPDQEEEDALREFVQWLRAHIVITTSGAASMTIAQFLDMIRAAAHAAQQAVSSPVSPLSGSHYLLDVSPVTPLSLPASLVPDYLRAVGKLYATELRPLWRPNWLGQKHGCAGSDLFASPDLGNRVLLASVTPTIGPDGLNSANWVVQGPIVIDDANRPYLLQLRLLQEWLITGGAVGTGAGAGGAATTLAAAGLINANGNPTTATTVGALRVSARANVANATNLTLTFSGYAQPPVSGSPQYIVKALPQTALTNLTLTFGGFGATGFVLSASKGGAQLVQADVDGLQLMVEVTRLG